MHKITIICFYRVWQIRFSPSSSILPLFPLFAIDHEGKVQKDLHNNDLEYIKYKFFYNDDEERKYDSLSWYRPFLFSELLFFLCKFRQFPWGAGVGGGGGGALNKVLYG